MKFSCDKNVLQEIINSVLKAVPSKSTLPILEGIYFNCMGDNLILSGYDLEIGIEAFCDAEISEKGSVVYNARIISEIIKNLPEGIVEFSCDANFNTVISCGYTKFEIKGVNGEEYPKITKINKEKNFKIKVNKFKDMIKQTIFAVGTNENRYILTGSLFEIENEKINIVSVDGYRLALKKEVFEPTDIFDSFVVPGKTLSDLLKVLEDSENELTVYYNKNGIMFEKDNIIMVSRILEGEFLNYQQIIPKDKETTVIVKTASLKKAFERVALINSAADGNGSPAVLKINDNVIDITCNTTNGTIEDHINANIRGKELKIGFNHKFFMDAIKACDEDEVKLEFTNSLSPCVIKPVEGDSFLYIVLPVRLKWK